MTYKTVSLDELMEDFTPERRERINKRAKELIAQEYTLRELRKAHELTQVQLAKKLGVAQENIAKLEKRSDMLLSTMRGYVEAMGGTLELVASFPDRPPVHLKQFSDVMD